MNSGLRLAPLALLLVLAGCAAPGAGDRAPSRPPPDLASIPDAVPRAEPRSSLGNPPFYEVMGRRYHVLPSARGHIERGVASWYGEKFHGRSTSSGEAYDMYAMTAAHKTLPLPSYVRVTNLQNGRSIVVRVNDRGPFVDNRIIDLSYAAAMKLDMIRDGTAMVELVAMEGGGAPPPPEPAVAAPDSMWVQVGAFGSAENADRLAGQLRGHGLQRVTVHRDEVGGRSLYRVRVGPVAGVEDYDRVVARMADLGIHDSFLALDE